MDFSLLPLAFIEGIGGPEMLMILMIVLILFGGQKLPEFARGLGKSIREFKKAASGVEEEFKRALEEDERKKNPPPPPPTYPSYPENQDVQDSSYTDPDAHRSETDPYHDSYVPPEVSAAATPAPTEPNKQPADPAATTPAVAATPGAENPTAPAAPATPASPAETPPAPAPEKPTQSGSPDHPGPA